jgi:hypothetical protein
MTIEQSTNQEEFEKLLHEKTGMTRAEAHALDWAHPDRDAHRAAIHAVADRRGDRSRQHTEAWEPVSDQFYELADDILYYDATTREVSQQSSS